MPLYIDLHVDPNLTLEEVKQYHVADKNVQEKYGVRYLQILLNQPQGHLFCLVEGPDKETCMRVHQEAHGNIACNILEITESDFSMLLNGKEKNTHDITINPDGSLDSGVRATLTFSLIGMGDLHGEAKTMINRSLHHFGGRNTESLENPNTVIFNSSTAAIDAAIRVHDQFLEHKRNIELRMGISAGMPLDEEGSLFESARKAAGRFAFIAEPGNVVISGAAQGLYKGDSKLDAVRVLNASEEKFLSDLFDYLDKEWNNGNSNILDFAETLNMSKSQLSRKLKTISKYSPNELINELRLRKSIQLMDERAMNVAEVTMAIGFSNPSYFSKCFRERFGRSPSSHTLKT